ncbi:MAG TPA: hypothetical protein VFC77_09180 [Myxococcota bacterium]|nr:hypothetical protein [Myxococcota bacterium]
MAKPTPRPGRAAARPGSSYADGHPLDEVHYLESKIILKPERFTSTKSFRELAKLVRRVADDADVGYSISHLDDQTPQIREVVFLDTADFRLYNHAFILRRRITYEHGFPVGEPEVVFKFRHPDLETAAALDVRPRIPGVHEVKFKAEALPLRDRIGGTRMLYSHNALFALSQAPRADRASLATLVRLFPCLAPLRRSRADRVDLVNQTIVEEVLMDLGKLDFGKGVIAKSNAALWRRRGDHRLLIGEYSFQARFDRANELHEKVRERVEAFFVSLQKAVRPWVSLGTTKTGIVYQLKGNPPQSHE